MSATTSYGSWNTVDRSNLTVEGSVASYLGEFVDAYDVNKIVDMYREAINYCLPEGVSLLGDEFYGPYPRDFDLDLAEMTNQVNIEPLARVNLKENP